MYFKYSISNVNVRAFVGAYELLHLWIYLFLFSCLIVYFCLGESPCGSKKDQKYKVSIVPAFLDKISSKAFLGIDGFLTV